MKKFAKAVTKIMFSMKGNVSLHVQFLSLGKIILAKDVIIMTWNASNAIKINANNVKKAIT